jgi:NAD(P)-dependent dehydrogenase (short-subunit alcohol dehydrogenase family)
MSAAGGGEVPRPVAFITGAGSGIGRASALELTRRGLRIVAADLDREAAEATAELVRSAGGSAVGVHVDVRDESEVRAAVDVGVARYGGVDVAVNCAGVLADGTITATTVEQWRSVQDVNVTGTFLVCRAVIPLMAAAGGGAIVNLASAAALAPRPGLAAYAVSKAAVVMLTKSIALDHASQAIRANCVCPGVVDTPMMALDDDSSARDSTNRSHPLGRVATAGEVAGLIGYLVSPECSFMTGAAVVFDGGLSLGTAAL